MSDESMQLYEQLATLLSYPTAELPAQATALQFQLNGAYPDAAESLQPFTTFVAQTALHDMEELYTRSFDIQAITTLDLGYVMFGDDYKRGELLSNLYGEHVDAGVDCGSELADHFPNILRLLPRLKDADVRQELVQEIVAPALKKMLGEFDPARVDRRDKLYKKHYKTLIATPGGAPLIYAQLVRACYQILTTDYVVDEQPVPTATSDFLKTVSAEEELV